MSRRSTNGRSGGGDRKAAPPSLTPAWDAMVAAGKTSQNARKDVPIPLDAFICMPSYSQMTDGASQGFWRATRLPDEQVYRMGGRNSLLTHNFNTLWVTALNLCREGRPPRWFAMQHSDIEPTDWWFDVLADEMDTRGLDVLGVVAPIKDRNGLSSTALDHPGRDPLAPPDGEPWDVFCRLTMQEVYRLPETFTSEDIPGGYRLLLNTGLWICRFEESWARQVGFTISNRITFDEAANRYHARCLSEDWHFSRQCHRLGLKIGATRKVALNHVGPVPFPNWQPWGDMAFDSARLQASVVPGTPRGTASGFELPEVDGWLTAKEGEALAELARGKRVLEIGSYCGLSTVCMAWTAAHVVSIDPHDGRATPAPRNTWESFRDNMKRYGVQDRVSQFVGTTDEVVEHMETWETFDLIFIDGAHDLASVRNDIAKTVPLLAPDGLIAFHDYRSPIDPEVTAAVDEFLAAGATLLDTVDSLAVVRAPALTPSLLEV